MITCASGKDFINATDSENKWSEEWLIDTGASGSVTYFNYKTTNTKPFNIIIKVRNGELSDTKCEGDIMFKQHRTGLRLGWHAWVSMGFYKKYDKRKRLLTAGIH